MIELGSEVRDKASGVTGIVIAETRHITGCIHYLVQSKEKDGKRPDLDAFDEWRLDVIAGPEKTGLKVHPSAPWIPLEIRHEPPALEAGGPTGGPAERVRGLLGA